MRRFYLQRDEDESGVSGTGRVAQGVEYDNGSCALLWLSPYRCHASYESIKAITRIHGHGDKTKIVFIDPSENGAMPVEELEDTKKD